MRPFGAQPRAFLILALGMIAALAWTLTLPTDAATENGLTIVVKLNPDRTKGGELLVVDKNQRLIAGPFPTLGKAANNTAARKGNPEASQVLPFGDTPSGGYRMRHMTATSHLNQSSYGPHGAIVLEPTDGNALLAQANGRTGLWIHGGAPGPNGGLRRTNGCLRLSNENMTKLISAIVEGSALPEANRCEVSEVTITVYPDDGGDDYDEGDPPPTVGGIILP